MGGIWDHGPQDRDQQLFEGSEIRLSHFVESGNKICHAFGIKDQKSGYKNGISIEKTYLVTILM